ncbi:MAG: hypothetical protein RLZZ306_3457 [Bacteroidota bacterium]
MSIQPKININLEEINTKKQRLEKIKIELKHEFIGIDYIIEELVDYIQIWYLMPEILTRPIIVNLWGMTGVGKTDLIRKLVSKLDYQDRFVEVELSNGESTWNSSVSSILETNGINNAKPAIVLFDEIQRFYTIDSEGKPLLNTRFQDFWELLSDGKLAKRDAKESIDDYLQRYLYAAMQRQKRKQKLKDAPPMPPDPMNPNGFSEEEEATVGVWEAQSLKKIFDLKESVNEIAEMREEDVLMMMQQTREKKKVYEPINHSKTLIIISGNLDEAYSMANETGETDIEADIFRAYTEKITIVDIKNALSRKFKPEQVARFGNIHLIYKSLRKVDFEALISEELVKIIKKNKEHFGVDIEITKNLNQLIYQNGVFPVQGVRPVFSSITDIVEANLSKLLFEAFMGNLMHIAMDYDFEKKKIVAHLAGKRTIELDYVGKIDQIRQDNSPDMVANIAVHESGHAIVYGILLGLAPLQLKSRVASRYAQGFSFPHLIHLSKENIISKIKIFLAGGIAEEIVFGEDKATISRSFDREEATSMIMEYIRKYGFDKNFQAYYAHSGPYSMELSVTDWAIEKMIRDLAKETRELLEKNQEFLVSLSKELARKGSLKPLEVVLIAHKFGHTFEVKEENYLHLAGYEGLLNDHE